MSSIVVSELEFAHPGGDSLFYDVGFTVAPGEHAAVVGANGTGKSTLLKVLAGELQADEGSFSLGGPMLQLPQDVGLRPGVSVREMLIDLSPPALRDAGHRLLAGERAVAAGAADGGMAVAEAIADWGDLGGYELEQQWDAAADRV